MPGEESARRIVQAELGRTVHLNDDGRSSSLYDLRIGYADAPHVAIEVTGAVDPQFTETWNIGPAKGSLHLDIQGDWTVEIAVNASVKRLRQQIEPLLQDLERRKIRQVVVDHHLRWQNETLFDRLEALGIRWASCYRLPGSGQVYLTMPAIGGAVDEQGRAIPEWLGEFLRNPKRRDVIHKLGLSAAPMSEAFVIVTFSGAPWLVESYLTGNLDMLPNQAPNLPAPLTGAWVVAGENSKGVRWNGSKWSVFRARGAGIDELTPHTA